MTVNCYEWYLFPGLKIPMLWSFSVNLAYPSITGALFSHPPWQCQNRSNVTEIPRCFNVNRGVTQIKSKAREQQIYEASNSGRTFRKANYARKPIYILKLSLGFHLQHIHLQIMDLVSEIGAYIVRDWDTVGRLVDLDWYLVDTWESPGKKPSLPTSSSFGTDTGLTGQHHINPHCHFKFTQDPWDPAAREATKEVNFQESSSHPTCQKRSLRSPAKLKQQLVGC